MSDKRKNVTISVNSTVHRDFKIECIKNSNEMSIVIENFMKSYISASQKLHAERTVKNLEHEQG